MQQVPQNSRSLWVPITNPINQVRGVALLLLMTADPTHLKPGMHCETHDFDMTWSVQRTLDNEKGKGSDTPFISLFQFHSRRTSTQYSGSEHSLRLSCRYRLHLALAVSKGSSDSFSAGGSAYGSPSSARS